MGRGAQRRVPIELMVTAAHSAILWTLGEALAELELTGWFIALKPMAPFTRKELPHNKTSEQSRNVLLRAVNWPG
jgi:hypothetical protein